MKSSDLLISDCTEFRLEYRITDSFITVTKRGRLIPPVTVKIKTDNRGDRLRILCGMLWAAKATPLTAQEMADELEF